MFFGIPWEIVSGIGSYLVSSFMSLSKARNDREEQRHRHDMAMLAAANGANLKWLKAQDLLVKNDPYFSMTRRLIALFVVAIVFSSLILAPYIFSFFGTEIPWILPVTEISDGFLGFFGSESTSYETLTGLLYMEWMGSAVMSIIGLYFGNRAGR